MLQTLVDGTKVDPIGSTQLKRDCSNGGAKLGRQSVARKIFLLDRDDVSINYGGCPLVHQPSALKAAGRRRRNRKPDRKNLSNRPSDARLL